MKQVLLWSLLLVVLACGQVLGADPQVPEVWTARNAVRFARLNSPDSLIASQRMLEARAMLTKADVGFYPQLILSSSYNQTNNPMYSFGNILNQGQFDSGLNFNNPGRSDNLTLKTEVQYRLYNGGQTRAHKDAATAGVDMSAAAQREILLQLEFDTFRSFQRIVEAQTVNQARLAALTAIRLSLAVARARYDAGDLLKVDLLNLEVQESRALENQIQAAHTLELAKKVFLTLVGLKADDVKISSASQEIPAIPDHPDLSRRPELQRLQAAVRASQARLRAARGSRLPTVDGFASYQYDKGYVFNGNGDSWMAGVKVNFKLFDGHNSAADIALDEARLGSLRAEQKKLQLALDLELRRAELAVSQARQRQQVTAKMVDQATESEQLSRAQFREGVILASDLIESETRLTDALVHNAVATTALQIAVADLRRAAGLTQFSVTSNVNPAVENKR